MQQYTKLELAVGAFIVAGALALGYLSISLGGLKPFASDRYEIVARFSSVGGLKVGDPVKISGVAVGEVSGLRLVDYVAEARFSLQRGVEVPKDTIASVQSNGLLGDAYVSLSPGADDKTLAPGERIARTEPAISLTELIAKYAFGSPVSESPEPAAAAVPNAPAPTAALSPSAADAPSPFSDPLE